MELYRLDFGDSGGPSELGLPIDDVFVLKYGLTIPQCIETGGYERHYGPKHLGPGLYTRLYPNAIEVEASLRYGGEKGLEVDKNMWREHIAATGGTVALYMDDTFCPESVKNSSFLPKPVFAVFTDGHISRKVVRGRIPSKQYTLWNNP